MQNTQSWTFEAHPPIPLGALLSNWNSPPPAPAAASAPQTPGFEADVLAGLQADPKVLPCKYFYDEAGSRLFDRICDLPEYYPTRAEEAILQRHGAEIAKAVGKDFALVEYGSGSSRKTRLLLEQVSAAAYLPIDISGRHLESSAKRIAAAFPALRVHPVCADYSRPIQLPPHVGGRRVIYFSGSTIGNFHPDRARDFLRGMRQTCEEDGDILIGVDLRKDPHVLWQAYNDSAGVTAEFNLNLLRRINRELGAHIDVPQFAHYAPYNQLDGRVEMHLVSRIDQTAWIGDVPIRFRTGQTIRTEYSYKYTLEGFAELAAAAGLTVRHVWTDPQNWFSLQHLRAA
jgi:dimethylhistidine N-methyltransferase